MDKDTRKVTREIYKDLDQVQHKVSGGIDRLKGLYLLDEMAGIKRRPEWDEAFVQAEKSLKLIEKMFNKLYFDENSYKVIHEKIKKDADSLFRQIIEGDNSRSK